MTLRLRLAVFGAVVPALALVLAILAAGWFLRRDALVDLDRHLLNQAAVESVGLFDAPDGRPHVHVETSPLAPVVAEFTAAAAIYDATGRRVSEVADPTRVPTQVIATTPVDQVALATEDTLDRRTLTVRVAAPDAHIYTLWLGLPLAPVADAMSRYYRATFGALGGLLVVLVIVQLLVARSLTRRVDAMVRFIPTLRDGRGPELSTDPVGDELTALREVLRAAAARLAEVRGEQDRLVADAAHELRTPLTVIRAEIDLALRRERSPEEMREALRSVRSEADRLTRLAGALLDLQAIRAVGLQPRDGDLRELVTEACRAISPMLDARELQIREQLPETASAYFDPRAIRQVVDNLLSNALRFAPTGSIITISVEAHGDGWRIAVADTGPGIPADQVEHVFAPFHRLGPSEGGGGGLGLAIVREIAERHGGQAGVDRAHTPGARVFVDLPGPATRPSSSRPSRSAQA